MIEIWVKDNKKKLRLTNFTNDFDIKSMHVFPQYYYAWLKIGIKNTILITRDTNTTQF